MGSSSYEELLAFLRSRVGDGLHVVVAYDETSHDVLYQSEISRRYVSEIAEKTPEEIREDFVLESLQSSLSSKAYGTDTYCSIYLSDLGTSFLLLLGAKDGIFFSIDPETEVALPTFVDECFEKIDSQR
ncbi:hypothetical protein G9464_15950 [Halostella sp. JP-L12]|uniref:hypothetical protein n=1 Tax=Halostella TaxID=1843185 RepID=UPI0013CE88DA|nr:MULTISPECIES: hypothetical protein [Halostella]NHN49073.1 hypothetical protein [Halostella sp. JP-L12]